uniref:Paired domain-containing protein n=1 Tax=Steinernema glaseri TaxID=37863 RepID=A0A1I7YBR9_9BILA
MGATDDLLATEVPDGHFVIDLSTPETLERDFYAWLNGERPLGSSPLPPIDRFSFAHRDSSSSSGDELLSDGGSPADSPPSSIASQDYDYRTAAGTAGARKDQSGGGVQGRSSGTNQLGRTYSPGLPLSMSEREQIVHLYQSGWKICDISKRLCVTHSCVSKILNRFRTTGSVRPKDAKEGRIESPLVIAIRDYRFRLGMTRQSEIREQLIADGICRRETAPSRSSINHILRTKLDLRKRKSAA